MKKLLYLSFLLLSLIISCTKSDLPPVGKGNFIELSLTSNVSSVTINTATISTTYNDPNATSVSERGVCWATTTEPTVSNSISKIAGSGSSGTTTNYTITGLSHSTKYYVRSYVKNNVGVFYSNEVIITTLTPQKAVLTTIVVGTITANSGLSGGIITSDGNAPITQKGVCYSLTTGPTTANATTSDGVGMGTYSSTISGLAAGTTYYVKAYAINLAGPSYGDEVKFTTLVISKPTLNTTAVTNITANSAISGGTIVTNGNAPITQSGVCYSTSSNPNITNNQTIDGTTTGTYISKLTGLKPGTTYYVKAYATNLAGPGYGPETKFTTLAIEKPTLSTTTVNNVTAYDASAGSSILSNGNDAIQQSGVCYSTSPNPTVSNSRTTDGSTSGSFTSQLSGLTPGTTYYVRAYATNAAGPGYASETSFTTSTISVPNVSTILSTYGYNTAIVSGTINSNGGSSITQSGVCYSTSPNPTTSNSKTTDGQTAGSWSSNISGLSPNTTYYARAYASNGAGPGYGSQVSFTTTSAPITCSITAGTTGVWFSMNISTSGPYVNGSIYSIGWSSPGYNYNFGTATSVELFNNETLVGSYGPVTWTRGNGYSLNFQLPTVASSSCYTMRVSKVEAGGATKVYISPRFRIN